MTKNISERAGRLVMYPIKTKNCRNTKFVHVFIESYLFGFLEILIFIA